MRRSKRTAGDQRLSWLEQADDAMNLGRLQRLFQREWRKNGCQPFCQHRLAGARRADQQYVMTTCRGDLQGALDVFLSFDFREIHFLVVIVSEQLGDVHFRWRDLRFALKETAR